MMLTLADGNSHLNPYTLHNPVEWAPKTFYPPMNVTLKLSRCSGKAKGDKATSPDMPEESGKGNQIT